MALFLPGELPFRDSIEGGYASMARFFAENPNAWGWNPRQYGGLPSQFTYLPALPYLTAALSRLPAAPEPEYVYRLLTATAACLGPVTLFLFVYRFTRGMVWATLAGLTYTLFSPVYGLIHTISVDRGLVQLPWRIQVLAKYGEGPHNAGLMLLPLAIIALWTAAERPRFERIFLAAVLLAATTLTNWVAALALAWCCLALLLTWIGGKNRRQRIGALLASAGLAYLLACFWLTPSFIHTIAFNWPSDAFNYKLGLEQALLIGGLFAGAAALRAVLWRVPRQEYLCFLTLALFGFAWCVLWFYWFGRDVAPESRRYAIEFEFFLILLLFELLRLAVRYRSTTVNLAAISAALILVSTGTGQAWRYVTKSFENWRPVAKEETIEYRLAEWIAAQKPQGRVFASGGLRFRLNSWFDLQQVGGWFESGLHNRVPLEYAYRIRTGPEGVAVTQDPEALLPLRALGVEYIAIHGPCSREHYRDFLNPYKFSGLLEQVYWTEDDAVYRVPFQSLAHLVRPEEVPRDPSPASLAAYVNAMDGEERPRLATRWRSSSELVIEGDVAEGMAVAVAVNYDAGWEALQDGRPIAVEENRLGFVTLRVRPAVQSTIVLRYLPSLEQKAAAGVSGCAWLLAAGGLLYRSRLRGGELSAS